MHVSLNGVSTKAILTVDQYALIYKLILNIKYWSMCITKPSSRLTINVSAKYVASSKGERFMGCAK